MNSRRLLPFTCAIFAISLFGCSPGEQTQESQSTDTSVDQTVEDSSAPVADTNSGQVQGSIDRDILVFKGIPYAASTAGENRFMPPQEPKAWSDVRDATEFGDQCPQIAPPPTDAYASWARSVPRSEDCLYLNVWTPALETKTGSSGRPVMVWFHGGGFAVGAGDSPVYNGTRLAKRGDVVMVTVNHRLNLFGYLHLADMGSEENGGEKYKHSANLGQQDLVASLQWVKDNIANFGGDPNNVTIFGQSGGGAKVSNVLTMPSAKGLFHRAIVQSGPGLESQSVATANQYTRDFLAALDLNEDQLEQLQSLPTDRLMLGMRDMVANSGVPIAQFGPVVDGAVIPRHPFVPDASPVSADVPVMVGYTKDETTVLFPSPDLFSLNWQQLAEKLAPQLPGKNVDDVIAGMREILPDASPSEIYFVVTTELTSGERSYKLASRRADLNAAPVWMYRLEWETPIEDGRLGSPHALDLPLMFDTVATSPSIIGGADDEAQKVADMMSAYWISFARDGDPNGSGLPEWPAYTRANKTSMVFNVETAVENDPVANIRVLILPE